MARFESQGTWFAAEEVAKRARALPRASFAGIEFPPPRRLYDRLRDLHAKLDRRGVTAQEAMRHLQDYHALVGEMLAQPATSATRLEEAEHRLRGLAEAVEKGHWSIALLLANARIFLAGGR